MGGRDCVEGWLTHRFAVRMLGRWCQGSLGFLDEGSNGSAISGGWQKGPQVEKGVGRCRQESGRVTGY